MNPARTWALLACIGLCGGRAALADTSAPLPADRNIVFDVADTLSYDDNVFRLPPAHTPGITYPGAGSSVSDSMNSAALQVNGNWNVGLQSIAAKLYAADNLFLKNTDLDNVSGSAKLGWDWVLSSILTGNIGGDYSRYLASFANTEFYAKDIISDGDYHAGLNWNLGPHWRMNANIRGETATHSVTARDADDYETVAGNVGLEYELSPSNALGVQYQFTHLKFRQGESVEGMLGNRDYQDNTISAYVKYALTAVTMLEAGAGYLNRTYAAAAAVDAQSNNFSGDIWHLSLNWQPTVQTGLRFRVWRDLRAYVDAESNYFVSRGESIGPIWSPLERLVLTLDVAHESQNFIGNDLVIGALPQRRDELTSGKLKIEYKIRRRVELDAGYNYEKRSSDVQTVIYKDNLATLSAHYSF